MMLRALKDAYQWWQGSRLRELSVSTKGAAHEVRTLCQLRGAPTNPPLALYAQRCPQPRAPLSTQGWSWSFFLVDVRAVFRAYS